MHAQTKRICKIRELALCLIENIFDSPVSVAPRLVESVRMAYRSPDIGQLKTRTLILNRAVSSFHSPAQLQLLRAASFAPGKSAVSLHKHLDQKSRTSVDRDAIEEDPEDPEGCRAASLDSQRPIAESFNLPSPRLARPRSSLDEPVALTSFPSASSSQRPPAPSTSKPVRPWLSPRHRRTRSEFSSAHHQPLPHAPSTSSQPLATQAPEAVRSPIGRRVLPRPFQRALLRIESLRSLRVAPPPPPRAPLFPSSSSSRWDDDGAASGYPATRKAVDGWGD